MKMVCTKKNLNTGLVIASRVIGSGNTLPILNNILFKTDEGRLKLSSTNLEMAINTWVGGKIEEEGEITVPARLVNDYVNNLIADKITISSKNQTLFLEAEKANTHIKGLSPEEFPLIPQVKEGGFAKIEGKNLVLAATDRYRLAERKVELASEVATPRQIIVPARTVNELARILGDGLADIYLTDGQICFKTMDTELVSRLIEGQYPDYKQIIPKNFSTEAEVEKDQLIQSLKGASLFASENNNIELDLNPQNKQIMIKSQSAQVGDSEIRLDAKFNGQKNSIIFNYRYLLECLNNLTDEKVVLKIINSSSPAAIAPVGRENYLYIVMPIKI